MNEKKKSTEVVDMIAKSLMAKHFFRTLNDTQEIFYYNEETGLYELGENLIEKKAELLLGDQSSSYLVSEIKSKIRRLTSISRNISNEVDFIPLNNGIYQISTKRLHEFNHKYFFTYKHPVVYEPMNHCARINKFLLEVAGNNIEKVWLLEKVAAYCFYRGYPIQNAFMLLGKGSNGKSVYLNLLQAMLGNENVSNQPLQALTNDKFASSDLYNKNANIFADLDDTDITTSGIFKSLTGEDPIPAQRKYQRGFKFKNYAKLIFSCNKLPETKDDSDAYYRRWIIIEFTKQFEAHEQNNNLLNELTQPSELSGWFDQIINHLPELLKENQFEYDTVEEKRKRYQRNANSCISFIEDQIEFGSEYETPKQLLFGAYVKYCKEKTLPDQSDKKLWKNLHEAFGDRVYESHIKLPLTGERTRVWKGIRLIESETKQETIKVKQISQKIMELLQSYSGHEKPNIPLDFIYSIDWKDDITLVQECVKQLKRSGEIYEPIHGFLRIDKKIIV